MSAITTFPRGAKVALATLTKPSQGIYLLSMHNLPDNRLTPDYIKYTLLPALDSIELTFRKDWAAGQKEAALVLTGERVKNKFFSNGLDLDLVRECPGFFKDYYYTLMSRLLTFPMHTVAAMNGHTFAGGFCLAQCTDTRIFRSSRAWTCMNELDFGAPLPVGMAAILQQRLSPRTLSRVMLTAHRFTGPEALAAGIVDEILETGEEVIERALKIAEERKGDSVSGVLSMLKQTLYAQVIEALKTDEAMRSPDEQNDERFKALLAGEISAKL